MTDPTPAPAAQPSGSAPFTDAEDKQYSTLATFLNIILLVPGLIFYFAFGNRGPKIKAQSKENLNWTINVSALLIIIFILNIILGLIPFVGFVLVIVLTIVYWALLIVNLIFAIIGGVKVSNTGEFYKYPVNIRWIK